MGETKSWKIPVLFGESGQPGDDNGELRQEDSETFSEEDQVGIIGDIARGGAQAGISDILENESEDLLDDTGGFGGNGAKGVDVSHNVV